MIKDYKSILVPYYGQVGELGTLDFTSAITREMGAEANVLYLSRILKEVPEAQKKRYWAIFSVGGLSAAMDDMDEHYRAQLVKDSDEAHKIVTARFKNHIVPESEGDGPILVDTKSFRWEQDISLETDTNQLLIDRAMLADVIVTSSSVIEAGGQRDVLMGVLKDSGRPLIIVPTEWKSSVRLPRRIVIGWKQSVHTVRAVTGAMPLLRAAHRVLVLEIEEGKQSRTERVSASDIARWLSRHGIATQSLQRDALAGKAENILEEEIGHFGADFLVMGAYSRSRTREMIFGGFTQHVLENTKIPTLLAH